MSFHTIKEVKPLENMILEVLFNNGEKKKYNMKVSVLHQKQKSAKTSYHNVM